jgi:hypothetical protein
MNVEGYCVTGNSSSYEAKKAFFAESKPFSVSADASPPVSASPVSTPSNFQSETYPNLQDDYRMDSAFMQVDSQRKHEIDKEEEADNFLKEYVKEEEEEEEEKNGRLVDYLLKALKGEEKELRMEGNSYMSAKEKEKYYQIHFPGLFSAASQN